MDYEREQLDELCNKFNLLGYVEGNFDVERRGREYAIHCPKHVDLTPSLFIKPDSNCWYCHSCRRNGGPIQWFMQIEGLTFRQSVEKLIKLTGFEIKETETASSFKFFKQLAEIQNRKDKVVEREILPESYMDQFDKLRDGEPKSWIEEGIQPEIMQKYGIRMDRKGNRIVYPVRDNNGNLIAAKGRTCFAQYKILGLTKYINYKKIGTTNYFQGMYENKESIIRSGEAIVFEGIKSVMKADAYGYSNCIAAETSLLNEAQAKILIQMGIHNVVIGFDNDVPYAELLQSANRLKRWMNVDLIIDKEGLLGSKEEKLSPVDKGKEIFDQLYKERQRVV